MRQLAKRGVPPETVLSEQPTIPLPMEYLWEWYEELLRDHRSSGWGLNPLTHGDVRAWAMLTRRHPRPWEVRLLLRLDDAFLSIANRRPESEKRRRAPGLPTVGEG